MAESLTFKTAELRQNPKFARMFNSEAGHELPDVTIKPYDGVEVTNRRNRSGHEIVIDGEHAGTLTLVGWENSPQRYAFNTRLSPKFQEKRIAVATYVGLIAVLSERGKHMVSDPMHLNGESHQVWESLVRRGLAQRNDEAGFDKFDFPRYVSSLIDDLNLLDIHAPDHL